MAGDIAATGLFGNEGGAGFGGGGTFVAAAKLVPEIHLYNFI